MQLKYLDQLIWRKIILTLLASWLLVVALDAMLSLLRELDELNAQYTLTTATAYILWTLPRRIYEWFLTAAIIGVLLGLGGLSQTSELIALRAGGVSKKRIAQSALYLVGMLTVIVALMGEFFTPYAEQQAQILLSGAKSKNLIGMGKTGIWVREGANILHARQGQVEKNHVTLHEVQVYAFDLEGKISGITYAKHAVLEPKQWQLQQVQEIQIARNKIQTQSIPKRTWSSTLDPSLLTLSIVRPENLGVRQLYTQFQYLAKNHLRTDTVWAALWQRLFYPLQIVTLIFAITPFAFGQLRSGGIGKRLFIGIFLAILWFFMQKMLTNLAGVYQLDIRLVHIMLCSILALSAWRYFRRGT